MNNTRFKYGGTIVVILQPILYKGGLEYKVIPEELDLINNLPYEQQWKMLEEARDNGGAIFYTVPSSCSAFRELLDDYIDKEGRTKEGGMKVVHTELHGDFCVELVLLDKRDDVIEDFENV